MTTPPRPTMTDPSPAELNDPLFDAIWNVVKSWDVNVPKYYDGYCGATGSHVKLIYDQVRLSLTHQIGPEAPSGHALRARLNLWMKDKITRVLDDVPHRLPKRAINHITMGNLGRLTVADPQLHGVEVPTITVQQIGEAMRMDENPLGERRAREEAKATAEAKKDEDTDETMEEYYARCSKPLESLDDVDDDDGPSPR